MNHLMVAKSFLLTLIIFFISIVSSITPSLSEYRIANDHNQSYFFLVDNQGQDKKLSEEFTEIEFLEDDVSDKLLLVQSNLNYKQMSTGSTLVGDSCSYQYLIFIAKSCSPRAPPFIFS